MEDWKTGSMEVWKSGLQASRLKPQASSSHLMPAASSFQLKSNHFCYIEHFYLVFLFLMFHTVGEHGITKRTGGSNDCCGSFYGLMGSFKIDPGRSFFFLFEHLGTTCTAA